MAKKVKVTAHVPPQQQEEPAPEQSTATQQVQEHVPTAQLPVLYDRVSIEEYSTASNKGPVTAERWERWLKWETEEEYIDRMLKEQPTISENGVERDAKKIDYMFGDDFHCLNNSKRKVRCHTNSNNRPFDMTWCEDLIHTILIGQWAGPHTIPGETINGETVRISRYGRVLSGQHQGTACKLADEKLQAAREKKPDKLTADEKVWLKVWEGQDQVFIETVVITGLSEDERVLRTIDYVKPRTVADMLFTMELFRKNTPVERKEMTRMLAVAVSLLWDRTGTKGYKTHPEIVGFLERHRRLLKCVEYLFALNRSVSVGERTRLEDESEEDYRERMADDLGEGGGRRISKLRISAGQASALCYLMGCSSEETSQYAEEYRSMSPPSEKDLDWSLWDRAKLFWKRLADASGGVDPRGFMYVCKALGRLIDSDASIEDNVGLGGRLSEKLAILANAWERFKDIDPEDEPDLFERPFDESDLEEDGCLSLNYTSVDDKGKELPDHRVKLVDLADFEGIDIAEVRKRDMRESEPPDQEMIDEEEVERAKDEARKAKEAKLAAKR